MKTIAVPAARARSNRSRTRLAPPPAKISTKSLPATAKKGTPASPATARASRVLPVPGGPTAGRRAACARPWPRTAPVPQELDDLAQLADRLVGARDVGEPVGRHLTDLLAALAVEAAHPAGQRAGLRQVEQQTQHQQHREHVGEQPARPGCWPRCGRLDHHVRGEGLPGEVSEYPSGYDATSESRGHLECDRVVGVVDPRLGSRPPP